MVSSDLTQNYTVRDPYIRNEQYKRCSRASDTSSAYSGSDMMQSSLESNYGSDDLPSNLMESLVDSDDEEGFAEATEVKITALQIRRSTVIIWNIGTDRSEQTVQTQIRLLLKEQSDQCLLCLLFCLHLLNAILHCKIQLFQL